MSESAVAALVLGVSLYLSFFTDSKPLKKNPLSPKPKIYQLKIGLSKGDKEEIFISHVKAPTRKAAADKLYELMNKKFKHETITSHSVKEKSL